MKKILLSSVLVMSSAVLVAQVTNPLKKLGQAASGVVKNDGASGAGLSTDQIVAGLKEALTLGAQNSTSKLSAADGFLKDAAVKILLPEEIRKVESKMRALGMGKLFDNAVTTMNRAAEDASKKAAPIFLNAIKNMSIQDALGILQGGDLSATNFLKKATTQQLTEAFRPIIDSSLEKVNATKYWTEVFTAYNKFSSTPVNTDLSAYVTEKSLDGIFFYVGEEEQKIRKDPGARVTDILKTVFK